MKLYEESMECLFCKSNKLETVSDFNKFPYSPGVTEYPEINNLYPFEFVICEDCGLLQQKNLIYPNILYSPNFKNEGVGSVWENHYKELSNFILRYFKKKQANVLEIGSAHDRIINNFPSDFTFTLCDPNMGVIPINKNIKIIDKFFEDYKTDEKFDLIILSHIFEHVQNPISFIKKCKEMLTKDGIIAISLPNFEMWIANGFLNAFSQEHTIYPFDIVLSNFFTTNNLEIFDKMFYGTHSIFYLLKNTDKVKSLEKYNIEENKKSVREYIKTLDNLSVNYKNTIKNKKYYIFGAHIFSQMLLFYCKLDKNLCLGLLDNSKSKQGKYLFGTELKCYNPEAIKYSKNIFVIVNAGTYTEEIKKQLSEINKDVGVI